jgi:hypothetical protein
VLKISFSSLVTSSLPFENLRPPTESECFITAAPCSFLQNAAALFFGAIQAVESPPGGTQMLRHVLLGNQGCKRSASFGKPLFDCPFRDPPHHNALERILRFRMLPEIAKDLTRKLWQLRVDRQASVKRCVTNEQQLCLVSPQTPRLPSLYSKEARIFRGWCNLIGSAPPGVNRMLLS